MSKLKIPNKVQVTLDTSKLIILVLAAVIAAMLLIWKPWQQRTSDRTIRVTGEAILTAEPDEYVFYPNYQFSGSDKDKALAELSAKSDAITAKLKELGVPDSKIRTNSSGNDYRLYHSADGRSNEPTYVLSFTITVNSKEEAQKVSDYLVTTTPLGSVSPQPALSDAKRKALETKARDIAVADAHTKAVQHARNLGLSVKGVKELDEGQGFGGGPIPFRGATDAREPVSDQTSQTSIAIQPGESELRYTVTVTYYVR